jgi:periplasmic protein TonB
MSTAAMTLRLRPRPRQGPALRRGQIPVFPLAVSAIGHVALILVLVLAATVWRVTQPKTYVVNLVPAVAAVPSPQSRPAAPERTAPAPKPAPDLPRRETSRELPAREPAAAKELPPASRPAAPREQATLPDRSLTPRAPAAPRPGDKELPTVARAPAPPRAAAPPTVTPPPAATPAPEAPPPPPPAGQPTGAPQGLGSLSLNVSDFPYTWYIQAVHRKIHERWEGRAIQGRQPEVIFEITRDGKLRGVSISKSSGNPAYDQFALRAVAGASPFPPLPQGFEKAVLTIGLQFIYDSSAR